jgi:hypothetical protein
MCKILPDVVKRKNAALRGSHYSQGLQGSLRCLRPAIDEEQAAAKIPDVTGDIRGLGGKDPAVHAELVPHDMGHHHVLQGRGPEDDDFAHGVWRDIHSDCCAGMLMHHGDSPFRSSLNDYIPGTLMPGI